jgi:hypothetical protein
LESPRISARAAEVGYHVAAEDGLGSACDAIESMIGYQVSTQAVTQKDHNPDQK